MRSRFDKELEVLDRELVQMGAMIERAIAGAAKALSGRDAEKAREVVALDEQIDVQERVVERLCLRLLLQQQPVARDLRLVSAALKMITDMERIGDQAADIAEIALRLSAGPPVRFPHIDDMARAVIRMVTESVDAFVRKDLTLVRAVIASDDVVDGLFREVRDSLVRFIAEHGDCGEQAIDGLMIAKYLERIGDHATNIAEWVAFSMTGDHHAAAEAAE